MDLDVVANEIDEPDLADAGSSVESELHRPVVEQRGVRDLNQEENALGAGHGRLVEVGTRPQEYHVRLGFRVEPETDRALDLHDRAVAAASHQNLVETIHHRGVA